MDEEKEARESMPGWWDAPEYQGGAPAPSGDDSDDSGATLGLLEVVTWQSPRGSKINICHDCEARLDRENSWPKDPHGGEYCSISYGRHMSTICDVHPGGSR